MDITVDVPDNKNARSVEHYEDTAVIQDFDGNNDMDMKNHNTKPQG